MAFSDRFSHNGAAIGARAEHRVRVAEYFRNWYRVAPPGLAREALVRWFDAPAGRALLAAERAACRQLATAPGFRLVHLGVAPGHGVADCFGQHCRFSLAEVPGSGVDAVVSFDALPLPSDTLDVVVLHHALDFAPYPHAVLVEAARTLRPGGRLILIAFNPYSLFGVRKWLLSPLRKATVWRHNSLRRARLVDWLALLGFAVDPRGAGSRGCRPLDFRGSTSHVIVATKRVVPLQPLPARPRVRSATLLGGYPAGRPRVVAKQRSR